MSGIIEHLWSWLCITPETFPAWYAYESPALSTAMGAALAPDLEQECRRVRIEPADLCRLLAHTAEIVYHGLFTVADNVESLAHLRTVERIASRYGVALPSAALFADSPWSARDGWGPQMTSADIDRWRSATWPPRN